MISGKVSSSAFNTDVANYVEPVKSMEHCLKLVMVRLVDCKQYPSVIEVRNQKMYTLEVVF